MATWVVVGHVGNFLGFYLGVNAPAWMKLALLTSVPVNVFIALSGFVVFEMLRRRSFSYGQYIRARAARILPIYLFALILAVLLARFRLDVVMSQPWRSASALAAFSERAEIVNADFWSHFVAHITLFHGLVPENLLPHASQALLAPAWSLSLEWQFYLVAPAIYMALVGRWWGVLAVAGLFAILQIAGAAYLPGLTNAAIINSWGYFFLGWICSRLMAACSEDRKTLRNRGVLMLSAMPLAIGSIMYGESDIRAIALSLLIWFAAFLAACWPRVQTAGVRQFQALIDGVLSVGWLRRIGECSYSLYLLHVLVLDGIGWIFIRNGDIQGGAFANYLLMLGAVLPISVVVAMLGYRFIERPFMKLGRSTTLKRLHGT